MPIAAPPYPTTVSSFLDHVGAYADTKYQKPAAGIPETDLAFTVATQAELDGLKAQLAANVKDPKWGPSGAASAHGAIADGLTHPLSAYFTTLAAAQIVYPHATALTDELDWAVVQKAINTVIAGGMVYIPGSTGAYMLSDKIAIKEKPVNLIGEASMCQTNSSVPWIREAATKFYSTMDKAFVHLYETDYASLQSQGSSVMNIAMEGNRTGSNQVGLWVDNRGTGCVFRNLLIAGMGSHGVLISDCVTAEFDNVLSHHNGGDGWRLDTTRASEPTWNLRAITSTTFLHCFAIGNVGNGWTAQGLVRGCKWSGGNSEGNVGWGVFFDAIDTDPGAGTTITGPQSSLVTGMWIEGNAWSGGVATKSIRINNSECSDNDLYFQRLDVTPSFVNEVARRRNSLHYRNVGQEAIFAGQGQRPAWQYAVLKARALNGTDLAAVTAREPDDLDDGIYRARSFTSTFGIGMDPGEDFPDALVPRGTDSFCMPSGRGFTWRNAAGTANIQGIVMSGDVLWLAAAGLRTVAQGDLEAIGDAKITTIGKGLRVKEGTNAKQGTVALVAGVAVVANSSVTANSRIFLTSQADAGTPGFLRVSSRVAGTSFTITSSSTSDISTVAYEICEPA